MLRNKNRLLLYTILGLTVVILLLISIFINVKFKETYENFRKVNQQNLVIEQASDVNVQLIKMGNAARSYITTRKPVDFMLLQQALPSALNHLSELKGLVNEDPAQLNIADSLEMLFRVRYTLWNNQIVIHNNIDQRLDDSLSIAGLNATKTIMALTQRLKENENKEQENYVAITEKGMHTAALLFLCITFFCIGVILFVSYNLYAEIKRGEDIQNQLAHKVEELNRSNTELERFAYVASHDLQEPVRKLHAFSGLLIESEKDNLSPGGIDIINRMQKFSLRMQKLIDDLLEYSLGFKKVELKSVDLNTILDDVKQDLTVNILKSKATIQADKLPVIIGSDSQLRQLFQNIIANSIRYAKAEVPPAITIKSGLVSGSQIPGITDGNLKKQFVKLVFSDNGIGFDNQYAEKIFLIFQRLHGKSEYEGTGIGLATCKLVVENHRGYISAVGRPGEGADFIIFLPSV